MLVFSVCQHAGLIIDLVPVCLVFQSVSTQVYGFGFSVPVFFIVAACRDNYRSRFNMPSFSLCQHAGIIINLVSTCLVFQSVGMQAYR